MPDLKFSCPHCQQHIAADPGYAGMQINCPACNGALQVPGSPPAPMPAPAAPPPHLSPAHASHSTAGGCPSCGTAMPRGAVLCTNCGYNTATGQRTVAGRPAAPGKPAKDQWETPWYKTAYPYVGLVVVVLAALYFLGKDNPSMGLAFGIVVMFYLVGVHILVAVAAFQEGTGIGFLTLCLPFFAIYYVFKINDNETLKILYGVALLIRFGTWFI